MIVLRTSARIALILVFVALACTNILAETRIDHHDLRVTLLPGQKRLVGSDRIDAYPDGATGLTFHLSRKASVEEVAVNDTKASFSFMDGRIQVPLGPHERTTRISVKVRYSAVFDDPVPENPANADNPGYGVTGTISDKGTFLLSGSGWYPEIPGTLSTYDLAVKAPAGILAISAGRSLGNRIDERETVSAWRVEHPVEGLALSAGRYVVQEKKVAEVTVMTYFFPENAPLAQRYIEAVSGYITFYGSLFGPYPYRKFAVVENFFPTGYSFPSYTLIGGAILRLPFIIGTSLGHEVAHSWWGNGVFVDPDEGNWCEGLTTYVADYLFKERASREEARDYRMEILRSYATLVNRQNDFPLSRFQARYDPASQAVGYGKGAMVFHMLRKKLGEDAFWDALRELYRERVFRKTSWDDLRRTFERHTKGSLKDFFDQWVSRPGAPRLSLDQVSLGKKGGAWELRGDILQADPPYNLDLVIGIRSAAGEVKRKLSLSGEATPFEFVLAERPDSVALDPDVDLFRALYPSEIPPSINSVKASEAVLFVISESTETGMRELAELLASSLGVKRYEVKTGGELGEEAMKRHDRVFLGLPAGKGLIPNLPKGLKIGEKGFTIEGERYERPSCAFFGVLADPGEPTRYTALFLPPSPEYALEVAAKITHYGKYSYLAFRKGQNVVKGIWPVHDSPLVWRRGEGSR